MTTATTSRVADGEQHTAVDARRYLVVSTDAHAGPSLKGQLREYCPAEFLGRFDDYARSVDTYLDRLNEARRARSLPPALEEALLQTTTCRGLQDPDARRRDMDADGVAADVIFAGGQNDEMMPFTGFGLDAGNFSLDADVRIVGGQIWNRWLADFISGAPHRHVGVMQIPIFDIEAAVREVEWGAEHGLSAVNLAAPRGDFPVYTEALYEPLWAACAANQMTLLTHSAGGESALGASGPMGWALHGMETHFLSRRGLWQLVFGGVFERYPTLKLAFAEQRVAWVPETLRDMDSIYANGKELETIMNHQRLDVLRQVESDDEVDESQPLIDDTALSDFLPRRPSEYWNTNCFLAASFLAPYEAQLRHAVGVRNLMWGSDYPHAEGTWPRTRLAMRYALADVPEDEVRLILGENALDVFRLDRQALRTIADRIGPLPEEISVEVAADELPEHRGLAFRTVGVYG